MPRYIWMLILLVHTGVSMVQASILTSRSFRKLTRSQGRRHHLDDYLRYMASRHLEDARQVVVWSVAEHRETFLADLECPRFVVTPSDLNLSLLDCELPIDAFFLFLDGTNDGVVADFLAGLPRCWLRAHFVVVFPEQVNPSGSDHTYLEEMFQRFWVAEAMAVVAVLPSGGTVHVFTFYPYRNHCHIAGPPVLVDQWPKVAGTFLSAELFPHMKVTSLYGCTLRLTIIVLAPDVILEPRISEEMVHLNQHGKNTLNLKDSLDGIEVRLVNALASKMNFSTLFALPSDGSNWGWIRFNGTVTGMIADINSNLSDIGFGHVTHSTQDVGFLEYSTSLEMDCYGWGVPLGAGWQPPAWMMFTTEFSSFMWGLLLIALLLAAVVIWTLPRALPGWEQQDKKLYSTLSSVLCFTCNTLISAPTWTKPSSQPVRMFVVLWLLYCIVVSAAYQAQLGSIVTIPWGPINIQSLDELMESDLKLRAHYKLQQTLRKSSEDDPVIREIMARLRLFTKVTELLDQLQSQRKQNFAYLMYRRSLEFYASQSGWKFHVMSEGCLMSHHTSLVVRRGSPLIPRLNVLIQQLIDAGIVNKWALDFTPRSQGPNNPNYWAVPANLLGAFMVLALGLLLSLLTLVVELCHSKLTAALP